MVDSEVWELVRERYFDLAYFFLRSKVYRETTSKGLVETWEKVRLPGVLVAGNAGNWRTKTQGFWKLKHSFRPSPRKVIPPPPPLPVKLPGFFLARDGASLPPSNYRSRRVRLVVAWVVRSPETTGNGRREAPRRREPDICPGASGRRLRTTPGTPLLSNSLATTRRLSRAPRTALVSFFVDI